MFYLFKLDDFFPHPIVKMGLDIHLQATIPGEMNQKKQIPHCG